MNKKVIRLTESDLHRIVKESVNRILEGYKKLNGWDVPWGERKALNKYDPEGFKLVDDGTEWKDHFSHKADSVMDYYDYINRVNTDYDDYDKKWEIEDSWKELNKLPNNESDLDDSSLFSNDYRCIKPEKGIKTKRDMKSLNNS